MSIKDKDLEIWAQNIHGECVALGIMPEGWTTHLEHGSRVAGRMWSLSARDSERPYQEIRHPAFTYEIYGYLGSTKKDSMRALGVILSVLRSLEHIKRATVRTVAELEG